MSVVQDKDTKPEPFSGPGLIVACGLGIAAAVLLAAVFGLWAHWVVRAALWGWGHGA